MVYTAKIVILLFGQRDIVKPQHKIAKNL